MKLSSLLSLLSGQEPQQISYAEQEKIIHTVFDGIVRVADEGEQERIREKYGLRYRLFITDHFRMISDTSPR